MAANEHDALLNQAPEESDEHAIIVFAHLMYLHKQAFEKGAAHRDEDRHSNAEPEDTYYLRAFQQKSLRNIKREESTGLGFCALEGPDAYKEALPTWVRDLSEETKDPWASLEKLSRVWTDERFTVRAVCDIVDVLGPFAYPFLHSLAVKVPRHLLKHRCLQRENYWRPVRSFPGRLWWDGSKPVFEHLERVAPATAAKRACSQGRNKIEVDVHFSKMDHLVQYPSIKDGDPCKQLELAVALLDADESTALFATPVGQALAFNLWDVAFPQFVRHKAMEGMALFVLVVLIAPVSHTMQDEEPPWPAWWKFALNLGFASYSALSIVLELFMVCRSRLFSSRIWRGYANTYNVCGIFVEIVSIYVVCMASYDYWLGKQREWEWTFLYQHPMMFGVLLFMKWLQLMISMINFDGLASTLLPAWCAIKSQESGLFLVYLFLLSLGSCFAYYVLPLDLGPFPANYFEAFFRMIRLGFLGDFEMEELEGKAKHIDRSDPARWTIEDSEGISEIKFSLKGFVMVLGLLFPVILLNVYVGLLSEEYKKAKDNQVQLIASFRTASVFRLHLHRLLWSRCPFCPALVSLDCFRCTIPKALAEAGLARADVEQMGTWTMMPSSYGVPPCSHRTHKLFLHVSNALVSDHTCAVWGGEAV